MIIIEIAYVHKNYNYKVLQGVLQKIKIIKLITEVGNVV